MPFEIDTGVSQWAGMRGDPVLDGILDSLPADAPQSLIDSEIYQHALGHIRQPKRLETARRHLCGMWHLIAPLAERDPDHFDLILNEYAERASGG